jgi:hypothetical protein
MNSVPVDYVVVELPAGASNFTGEVAERLLALVDAGTIRVIDVLIQGSRDDRCLACASFFSLGGGGLRPPEPQLRGTCVNITRGHMEETGFPP